jgi:spermidine/putrescine-binding protein
MKKSVVAGAGILAAAVLVSGIALLRKRTGAGKKENTLRVYVWTDYLDKSVISEFEKKFHAKVIEENFPSNEVMISKLQAGGGGFDLIVPSDYMIQTMRQQNLLMPLPKDKIPNLSFLSERFKKVRYDPAGEFTVPYMWGTTGIAYNSAKISQPPSSWKEFFDPAFARAADKRISLLDDPREVIGAALKSNGHSLNSTAEGELSQAKLKIINLKQFISRFDTMSYKDLLASGDLWMAQAYSGDVVKMQAGNPELRYVIPKDGATLWVDNLAIPSGSANPQLAAEFINFIMEPSINSRIAMAIRYATTNEKARQLLPPEELANPSVYPPKDVEERLELFTDLGSSTELIDNVWAEVRAEDKLEDKPADAPEATDPPTAQRE